MRFLAKALLWVGRAYLAFAALVILIGLAGVLVRGGVRHLWEVASPLDPRNTFAVVLTLAPGLILVWVADWLGMASWDRAGAGRPRGSWPRSGRIAGRARRPPARPWSR